jgi:predicted transcriptional regulator
MKEESKKIKAFKLRKRNLSYGQISKLLKISKSTVSYWFKNIDWSKDIKKQLIEKSKISSSKRLTHLNNLKQKKWNEHYLKAEKEARKEFSKIKSNKLFTAGIVIYWGEGDKIFKNGRVRVSNTDEKMLKVFNNFLQKICNIEIEKIRANILSYPDLNLTGCLDFWSKNINIPQENFFKSTPILGKHRTKKLNNGVCIISVSDKYLKKKILTWLDLFIKEF